MIEDDLGKMGQAAIAYVREGFAVFPLQHSSKDPFRGSRGFKDATKDVNTVHKWWTNCPDANIGLAMGAASGGIFAVDVDDNHGDVDGSDSLVEFEEENGELPRTRTNHTGSGGMHYLYRAPAGVSVKSAVGVIPSVDVRGDGGYIVAPPSRHPNGNMYVVVDGSDIADANDIVMKLVTMHGAQERQSFELPKIIGDGERNTTLYKYACSLQSRGLPDDFIFNAVIDANNSRCAPRMPESEVRNLVNSALGHDKGKAIEEAEKGDTGFLTKNGKPIIDRFAAHLVENHKACKVDGVPAIWNDGHYALGWHEIDRKIVEDCTKTKKNDRSEIRDYLNITMPEIRASDSRYVAFTNGVLDTGTGEFLESSPDFVITNVIPHRWNPDAKCDVVDGFLRDISNGHEPTYLNLIETMGICMVRSNRHQECPVLIGEGANGKSTFIKALRFMLGNENVSSLDVSMFGERFYTQYLAGKLANLGDDISSEFLDGNKLAVFRKVISGEWMSADVKGSNAFDFKPYCTVVISANDFPRMKDSTYGISRRLHPIPFNARFMGASRDAALIDKLETEEAAERMIQLAARGLAVVAANGNQFSDNPLGNELRKKIERDSDSVLDYIFDTGKKLRDFANHDTKIAYRDYEKWCNESGTKPVKQKTFSRRLVKKFNLTIKDKMSGGYRFKIYAIMENEKNKIA